MRLSDKLIIVLIILGVAFLTPIHVLLTPFISIWIIILIDLFALVCGLAFFIILKNLFLDRIKNLAILVFPKKRYKLNSHESTIPHSDDIQRISQGVKALNLEIQTLEDKLINRWQGQETLFLPSDSIIQSDKERLAKLAHYDSLTTLPNRIFFNEILNKNLNHAARQNKSVAILFIDLDNLKTINETLGHDAGDKIIKEFAFRYSSILRKGDMLARLGGDEFVVLLTDIKHPKFASSIADKILQTSKKPLQLSGEDYYITASIGICIFPDDGDTLELLQKNADIALYKAKCAGGGVYKYYSNEMTQIANKHVELDKALRKAITDNEFIFHYQPKLNLHTGKIAGVEALIRWNKPDFGILTPDQFIPEAEEMGLIMKIGEWAVQEACRVAQAWQRQGYEPLSIAVNLSPKQFYNPQLVSMIESALQDSQLTPHLLELEITENSIIEDVALTADKLNAIKHLGVKICIDDFGTGYTSINFLKKFPIDVLKIDQSFVKGIPQNQNDIAITTAIIALGHNLEIQVVAEGVETMEQMEFLIEHQCDLVQGYYYSRPVPESKLLPLLIKKTTSARRKSNP